MDNAKLSSASVEHLSPEEVAIASTKTLGRIDLDPASCLMGNRVIGAETYWTFMDGSLKRDWFGRVYLNPPGGVTKIPDSPTKSRQAYWWLKLSKEWASGRVSAAVFLGFSIELLQTVQQIPDAIQPMEFPICVPKKRFRFDVAVGGGESARRVAQNSPTHANVLVYLPPRDDLSGDRFAEAFKDIGKVKR